MNQYRFEYAKGNKVKFQMQSQEKPNVKATILDGYNLKLSNLDESMEYRTNENFWQKVKNKEFLLENLLGYNVIQIRRFKSLTKWASEIQTFYLKNADMPSSVKTKPGKLFGLSTDMEYKLESSSQWISVTEKEVTGLVAGTYLVRIKATHDTLASQEIKIVVEGQIEQEKPNKSIETIEKNKEKSEDVQKEQPKKPEVNKPTESKENTESSKHEIKKVESSAQSSKPEPKPSNKPSVTPNKPNVIPSVTPKPKATPSKPTVTHTPKPKNTQVSHVKVTTRRQTRQQKRVNGRVSKVRNRRVVRKRARVVRARRSRAVRSSRVVKTRRIRRSRR